MDGCMGEGLGVTFWVLCDRDPRREVNVESFGIVLDLTTEKNISVCREAVEEGIDLKLSAFVEEEFDPYPVTIVKAKNPRARISML